MEPQALKNSDLILSEPTDAFGARFPVLISKTFSLASQSVIFRSDPLPPGLMVIGFGLVNYFSDIADFIFEVGTIADPLTGLPDWKTARALGPHFLNRDGAPRAIHLPSGSSLKLYDLKFPLINPSQCLAVRCSSLLGCRVVFSLYLICSIINPNLSAELSDESKQKIS